MNAPARADGWQARAAAGLRSLLLGGLAVFAVAVVSHLTNWAVLVGALGPTVYVFIAHPASSTARMRNAAVGHAAAVVAGLASVACFGLAGRELRVTARPTVGQAAAGALALGITLFLLEMFDTHHAPAAATALLVGTGLVPTWRPVGGLVVSLAVVITLTPLLAQIAGGRHESRRG